MAHRLVIRGAGLRYHLQESGFCKPVTLEEMIEHGHLLTSGRYVEAPETEGERFDTETKMNLERMRYGR